MMACELCLYVGVYIVTVSSSTIFSVAADRLAHKCLNMLDCNIIFE